MVAHVRAEPVTGLAVLAAFQVGSAFAALGFVWYMCRRDWSLNLRQRIQPPTIAAMGGAAALSMSVTWVGPEWVPWVVLVVSAMVAVGLPLARVSWSTWHLLRRRGEGV